MVTAGRTEQVDLDEKLVSYARSEATDANRPDEEIIEEALSGYLLERLLDKTQSRSRLPEDEATHLAVEELRAMQRERDAAA